MRTRELIFGGLLVIIAITLIYYVFIYLPAKDKVAQQQAIQINKEKEKTTNLALQQKCRDAGERAYNQVIAEENIPGVQLVSNPRYYYSKEKNQCLYSYEISGRLDADAPKDNGIPWQRYVKDSLTNQEVMGYIHNVYDKSSSSQKAMMDYSKKEDQIMGIDE